MKKILVGKKDFRFVAHKEDKKFNGAEVIKVARLSNIEPFDPVYRLVFKAIRLILPKYTQWTRTWDCFWQVKILHNGYVYGPFITRKEAIMFETAYFNKNTSSLNNF